MLINDEMLPQDEAARLIGCSEDSFRYLAGNGYLGIEHVEDEQGRTRYYFSRREIERRDLLLRAVLEASGK